MARRRKLTKRSSKRPSFFKILLGDFSEFSQRLRVPPLFIMKNFNGRTLRKCALRGPSGQMWDVKLENSDKGLFFLDGWQGFVKNNALEAGNLLVFSYNGESKFKVKIYDKTACAKVLEVAEGSENPVSRVNEGQARVKDEVVELETENYSKVCENKTIVSSRTGNHLISRKRPANNHVEERPTECILFKSENPCFLLYARKRHWLNRMYIPKKLAVAEGLMTKDAVMLQDPAGRSWLVRLAMGSFNRLDMTIGWTECRKANKISPGDTIVFEFVKQGVMHLHFSKKGAVGGNRCSVVIDAPNVRN